MLSTGLSALHRRPPKLVHPAALPAQWAPRVRHRHFRDPLAAQGLLQGPSGSVNRVALGHASRLGERTTLAAAGGPGRDVLPARRAGSSGVAGRSSPRVSVPVGSVDGGSAIRTTDHSPHPRRGEPTGGCRARGFRPRGARLRLSLSAGHVTKATPMRPGGAAAGGSRPRSASPRGPSRSPARRRPARSRAGAGAPSCAADATSPTASANASPSRLVSLRIPRPPRSTKSSGSPSRSRT